MKHELILFSFLRSIYLIYSQPVIQSIFVFGFHYIVRYSKSFCPHFALSDESAYQSRANKKIYQKEVIDYLLCGCCFSSRVEMPLSETAGKTILMSETLPALKK